MRLTCPNCDAQYEVDDNAIPETGRDVQCSNCGHAWFQLPQELEDAPPAQPPIGAPEHPAVEALRAARAENASGNTAGEVPGPHGDGAYHETDHEAEDEYARDEPGAVPQPSRPAPRRALDDGLKQLLREEADREFAARRAEGGGLEMQPDLGLDEGSAPAPRSTAEARDEVPDEVLDEARAEAQDEAPGADVEDAGSETARAALAAAGTTVPAGGARRDLLPDIEEINSTLRANSERGPEEPGASADAETPAERRRGFRRGFSLMLLAAVVLAMLYLYAPKIAQSVPAAAGPLQSYVQTVDKGRVWLDEMMQRATRALTGAKTGDGA